MNVRWLRTSFSQSTARPVLASLALLVSVFICSPSFGESADRAGRISGEIEPVDGYSLDGSGDSTGTLTDARLIGFWECREGKYTVTVEFLTDNKMILAGLPVTYELLPGIIRVHEKAGFLDYDYSFRGNTLCLTLVEDGHKGMELRFRRVDLSPRTPIQNQTDR